MTPVGWLTLSGLLTGLTAPSGAEVDPAALARVRVMEQARIEMVQRLSPAVVCIFPRGSRVGGGSGVIIDSAGYGLTNFHVIRPMWASRRGDAGMPDGKVYPLEVLGVDPTGDVAMFRVETDRALYPAPLGDAYRLRLGDWTLAMGNPFLLAEDFQPTVTCGVVSGLHRYQRGEGRALVYTDCIQVDTSINPGNSGGPLFDLRGELVGINGRVSIEERGRVNVGVGYAITINQVRRFIPALRAGLVTPHAALGATARDRGLNDVIIDRLMEDSCAAKAGLRLGDRVVRFGGVEVRSANHLMTLLGTYPAGWPVAVSYERGGTLAEALVRLDRLPLPDGLSPPAAVLKRLKMDDPMRPNREANRRAVARALERYRRATASPETLARMGEVRAKVSRRRARAEAPAPSESLLTETRPAAGSEPPSEPGELEPWIRWWLLAPPDGAEPDRLRVVGGDEVRGRIAVVLERSAAAGPRFRASFDDESGELLALEWSSGGDGERVRFEYGDYRRAGPLRWPHRRWMYLADKLVFEDALSEVMAQAEER